MIGHSHRIPIAFDPETVVKEVLIAAGTTGISQKALSEKVKQHMKPVELKQFLANLNDDRKVDKYEISNGGAPATWWRATREIYND